jgi:uncharacterized protein
MKRYRIKVIPRSSKNQVLEEGPGELKVKLTAPPVEGKANEALIKILADHFKTKKSSIRIVSGSTSRSKWVEVK